MRAPPQLKDRTRGEGIRLDRVREELLALPSPIVDEMIPADVRAKLLRDRPVAPRDGRTVVLLPGIMACEIATRDESDEIWLDAWEIFQGKIEVLRLAPDGLAAAPGGIECWASDVLTSAFVLIDVYLPTMEALEAEGFEVVLLPYDWRKPIAGAVAEVQGRIEGLLAAGRRVSVLGHSMGGLLGTLAAFGEGSTLGPRLERFAIGAVPFLGSFGAPAAFLGDYGVVQLVAAADPFHSREEVAEIIATFPGIHDLMPSPELGRGADRARELEHYGRGRPSAAHLARSLETQRRGLAAVERARRELGERFLAFAGTGSETPCEFLPGPPPRVRFGSESPGDGTVLLDSASAGGRLEPSLCPGTVHFRLFSYDFVAARTARFLASGERPVGPVRSPMLERETPEVREAAMATFMNLVGRLKTTPPDRLFALPARARLSISRAFAGTVTEDPEVQRVASELALAEIDALETPAET